MLLSRYTVHKDIKFFTQGKVLDYNHFVWAVDYYKGIFKIANLGLGDSVFFCVLKANFNTLAALVACYELGICITYLDRRHYIDEFVPEFQKKKQHKAIIHDLTGKPGVWGDIPSIYIHPDYMAPVDVGTNEPIRILHDSTPAGVYYTSGTTGQPKEYIHTHELIHFASSLAVKYLYREANNVLLLANQNINHVGVLTTVFMPILMTASNVFFMDEIDDLRASGMKINHVNLFEHNKHYLPLFEEFLDEDTIVLTGGKLLNPAYLDELLSHPKISRVHNIFGCTDVCTPLFHTQFSKSDIGKTEEEVRLLQPINEYAYKIQGEYVTQVKLPFDDDFRIIPDMIKVIGNRFLVVGRSDRVAQSKDGEQYITLFEFDIVFREYLRDVLELPTQRIYEYHTIRLYNNENYRNQVLVVTTDLEMANLLQDRKAQLNDYINTKLNVQEKVETSEIVYDVMHVKSFEPFSGSVKVNSSRLLDEYEKVSGTRLHA